MTNKRRVIESIRTAVSEIRKTYNVNVDIKSKNEDEVEKVIIRNRFDGSDIDLDCDFCNRFIGENELIRYDNSWDIIGIKYKDGSRDYKKCCLNCYDVIENKGIEVLNEFLDKDGDECYECGSNLKLFGDYYNVEDMDEEGYIGGDGRFCLCNECKEFSDYSR